MKQDIFTHLTKITKFYKENQTLALLSSIDENISEKGIKNLKNRNSPSGWTYEFGYIWYEEEKLFISQIDPLTVDNLNNYTPWEVSILKNSNINYLIDNIKGRSNRRYIPLISNSRNSKTFSIATYREVIDSQQTKLGLEKYFYLDAANRLEEYCSKEIISSPDNIYSSLDKYFEKIVERSGNEKYGLYFPSIYEIKLAAKLISYIPNRTAKKIYTQIFTHFLQHDIRNYYKSLGEIPPKKKILIYDQNIPLLTPFIEAFEINSNTSAVSKTLIYVEDILSLKRKAAQDIGKPTVFSNLINKFRSYAPLLPALTFFTSFFILSIEANWEIPFLLSIFSGINASALVPVVIFSAITSALCIIIAILLYYIPEKLISWFEIFLLGLPFNWIRLRYKKFAPVLAWLPWGILTLIALNSLDASPISRLFTLIMFTLSFFLLGKTNLFKLLRQEPRIKKVFLSLAVVLYVTLMPYSSIILNTHPVKNCAYVLNGNRLEYYEYIVLNSWAERSEIAVLKIENFDISGKYIKVLSEDNMRLHPVTIIPSEGSVISTPSVINTANNLLPPKASCPTKNPLPASDDTKSKEYIDSLSKEKLLYEFLPDNSKFILKELKGPFRPLTKTSNLY